jgi:hypothetical protein
MDQTTTSQGSGNQTTEELDLISQRAAFYELMQECNDCQQEIEPHWQFCAHCGTRLATSCPGCGNPLPPAGVLACFHCGLQIPQIK